jgi:hypothetical protein
MVAKNSMVLLLIVFLACIVTAEQGFGAERTVRLSVSGCDT